MGVYIRGMEMPTSQVLFCIHPDGKVFADLEGRWREYKAIPVPPHGRLKKRLVYRGEVYNALEAARINSLDGILSDPYKEGFHDGLKRAIQILANEVEDAPAIIEADCKEERTVKWREWNTFVPASQADKEAGE